jgi:hypothetical protein
LTGFGSEDGVLYHKREIFISMGLLTRRTDEYVEQKIQIFTNFGVKKSRIEGVCDATNSDSSTSSLQSDLQDVQNEGKTTSTQKKKSAFTHKYMDSYLKFGFMQCPDIDQLPQPQCHLCYCSGQ